MAAVHKEDGIGSKLQGVSRSVNGEEGDSSLALGGSEVGSTPSIGGGGKRHLKEEEQEQLSYEVGKEDCAVHANKDVDAEPRILGGNCWEAGCIGHNGSYYILSGSGGDGQDIGCGSCGAGGVDLDADHAQHTRRGPVDTQDTLSSAAAGVGVTVDHRGVTQWA